MIKYCIKTKVLVTMRYYFSLILPLLLFSCMANGENRPGFVCGKFNGNVIEVPANYVFPFAEFEGYSYFDPRFIKNKKGCEANFNVLPLRMTWPEMNPIGSKENNKEIKFSIEPLDGEAKGYLESERYIRLDRGEEKTKGNVLYDEKLDLYFSEVKLKKMNKYIDPEKHKSGYYWRVENNKLTALFNCLWIPRDKKYERCDAIFLIPEYKIRVNVILNIDDLIIWDEMESNIANFIYQYIKK